MQIKKHIPNFLTMLNLLSGATGIVALVLGYGYYAGIFIWIGMFFDFLDGFTARLLSVTSAIGQQLDTLADLITFGLLPTLMMYGMIYDHAHQIFFLKNYAPFFASIAFVILICSALRLARFNLIGTNDYFMGMPTPANAFFISTLHFLIVPKSCFYQCLDSIFVNTALPLFFILVFFTLLFSLLLIAPLYFFNFKFSDFSWHLNKIPYIFLLGANFLVFLWPLEGLPFLILWYAILSIFFYQKHVN